jgi:hypothetical protein
MSQYSVSSPCECQANLTVTLDENRNVVAGTASRGGAREVAPAHGMSATAERFDVGWLCPFCGRNTLRSFHIGALRPA